MSDTTGSECSGKGRGSHVGQKHFEKAEKIEGLREVGYEKIGGR